MLTWNDRRRCLECLSSLAKDGWVNRDDAEVFVIDNGSTDGTGEAITSAYPTVCLIRNDRNIGTSARNAGVLASNAPAIMFLDDDTIVQPGAVEVLMRAISRPHVGVVGPRLTDPAGSLQYTCRLYPTLAGKLARRLPWRMFEYAAIKEELRTWDHSEAREVDYVIGACLMVRRELLNQIGLFDERIFYGGEDVDLCLRARLSGWKVLYQPEAWIIHHERRITRGAPFSPLMRHHVKDLAYLFWKHQYLVSRKSLYKRIQRASEHSVST